MAAGNSVFLFITVMFYTAKIPAGGEMCLTILLQDVPFLLILGMFVPDIAAEGLIFVEVRYINATMSNILKVRSVNDYARYLGGRCLRLPAGESPVFMRVWRG